MINVMRRRGLRASLIDAFRPTKVLFLIFLVVLCSLKNMSVSPSKAKGIAGIRQLNNYFLGFTLELKRLIQNISETNVINQKTVVLPPLSWLMNKRDSTDLIGGLFITAVGLFFVIYAQRYNMGTLNRMGPAYFPIALGAVLAFLGLLIAVPAWFRAGVGPDVNWKTLFIVIGSVVLFGSTLQTIGLIFATMVTVIFASLADNDITWRGRGILAVCVAPFIYLIFIFGLGMTVPIWPWSY